MLLKKPLWATAARLALFVLPLLLVLAACSTSSSTSTTPTSNALTGTNATNTPVSNSNLLAILPLLQKSAQAMQQITSAHVDLQGKVTIQTSGPLLPTFANAHSYTVLGSADVDMGKHEGQGKLHLKELSQEASARARKVTARLLGQKLSLQARTHQWSVLDLTAAAAFLQAHALGSFPQPQERLTLLQHITVTDHGTTTLDGHQVRHLTLSIDQKALSQLTANLTEQQAKQVLASMQTPAGLRVDLFLDTASSLLVRAQLAGDVRVDVDALHKAVGAGNLPLAQGNQARTITLTVDLTITLSKFNQPIPKVVAPAHTTPIDLTKLAIISLPLSGQGGGLA